MPVTAVSASPSAAVQAASQRKPPETQAERPEKPEAPPQRPQVDEAARARQAQQQQAQKTEPPRPVLNAQGQKTGQVISVTA